MKVVYFILFLIVLVMGAFVGIFPEVLPIDGHETVYADYDESSNFKSSDKFFYKTLSILHFDLYSNEPVHVIEFDGLVYEIYTGNVDRTNESNPYNLPFLDSISYGVYELADGVGITVKKDDKIVSKEVFEIFGSIDEINFEINEMIELTIETDVITKIFVKAYPSSESVYINNIKYSAYETPEQSYFIPKILEVTTLPEPDEDTDIELPIVEPILLAGNLFKIPHEIVGDYISDMPAVITDLYIGYSQSTESASVKAVISDATYTIIKDDYLLTAYPLSTKVNVIKDFEIYHINISGKILDIEETSNHYIVISANEVYPAEEDYMIAKEEASINHSTFNFTIIDKESLIKLSVYRPTIDNANYRIDDDSIIVSGTEYLYGIEEEKYENIYSLGIDQFNRGVVVEEYDLSTHEVVSDIYLSKKHIYIDVSDVRILSETNEDNKCIYILDDEIDFIDLEQSTNLIRSDYYYEYFYDGDNSVVNVYDLDFNLLDSTSIEGYYRGFNKEEDAFYFIGDRQYKLMFNGSTFIEEDLHLFTYSLDSGEVTLNVESVGTYRYTTTLSLKTEFYEHELVSDSIDYEKTPRYPDAIEVIGDLFIMPISYTYEENGFTLYGTSLEVYELYEGDIFYQFSLPQEARNKYIMIYNTFVSDDLLVVISKNVIKYWDISTFELVKEINLY